MYWLSPFSYMEAKFGPYKNGFKKSLTTVEIKFFRTAGYTIFDHKGIKKFLKS